MKRLGISVLIILVALSLSWAGERKPTKPSAKDKCPVCGMGVGVLMPFRNGKSLSNIIPPIQRRLALVSLILFMIFRAIVTYRMVFSDFILGGY